MIIGIYGYQDSGKTTLAEDVIIQLSEKGYRVSSVKHSPHKEEIDEEGKDSWRHSKAGSDPVVLDATAGTAVFKKPGMTLEEILRLVQTEFRPDVLVVEGRKTGDFPKIAVGDIEPTKETVLVNPKPVEAVAFIEREVARERVMAQLPGLGCGKCGSSCSEMAKDIVAGKSTLDDCPERPARAVEIFVDGQRLPVGGFVAEITEKTIRGFLSSLKGYAGGGDVEIRLHATDDGAGSEQ